jgi:hypothetical protein
VVESCWLYSCQHDSIFFEACCDVGTSPIGEVGFKGSDILAKFLDIVARTTKTSLLPTQT